MCLQEFVCGHEMALDLLRQSIATQRLSQSLLITGTQSLGKATLARAIAIVLNCAPAASNCHDCPATEHILGNVHPDVIVLDDEDAPISIQEIRTLQHDLSLRPYESRYKVAILCDFERATISAANALLKTLEEPPDHVRLILTARNSAQLLPTIVSRCQVIPLKVVAPTTISTALQTRFQLSMDQATLLSRLSAGRPGWAIRMLENPELLQSRQKMLLHLLELLAQGYAARLAYAQKVAAEAEQIQPLLNLWLTWWHDVMLVKHGIAEAVVNIDLADEIETVATTLSGADISGAIKQMQQALQNLRYNVNSRLNLEVLLLNLPRLEQIHMGS